MSDERWLLIYYGREEDPAGHFIVTDFPLAIACVGKLLKLQRGDALIADGPIEDGVVGIYMGIPPRPNNMVAMAYRIDNLAVVNEPVDTLPGIIPTLDKGKLN